MNFTLYMKSTRHSIDKSLGVNSNSFQAKDSKREAILS